MHNALGVLIYLGSYGAVAATAWVLYQQHLLGGWFLVLVVTVATGYAYLMSLLWPRKDFRETRSAVIFQTPIIVFSYLTNDFLVRPIALVLAWWIASLAPLSWNSAWTSAMQNTSPFILILGCLLFYEGTSYIQHRIFHAVPTLWRISHSLHHEPQTYGAALAIRVHYLEYFTTQMTRFVILAIFQVDPLLVLITVSVSSWSAILLHANTCLRFGWINYVVATPETHVWHHAPDKRVNYAAGVFSIFDWLGGTFYYRPCLQPMHLGVHGIHKPRSFFDMVLCRSPHLRQPSLMPPVPAAKS